MVDTPQFVALTPELLDVGARRVHNYDSFGRAVLDQVLSAAARQEGLASGAVSVPAEFTVRSSTTPDRGPAARSGCIDIEFLGVHIHVEWE